MLHKRNTSVQSKVLWQTSKYYFATIAFATSAASRSPIELWCHRGIQGSGGHMWDLEMKDKRPNDTSRQLSLLDTSAHCRGNRQAHSSSKTKQMFLAKSWWHRPGQQINIYSPRDAKLTVNNNILWIQISMHEWKRQGVQERDVALLFGQWHDKSGNRWGWINLKVGTSLSSWASILVP